MEDWMHSFLCRGTLLAFVTIFVVELVAPVVRGQSAGSNVNMVSGTGWTNGDPFLQRQNEPTIAVSTRNTLHLVAGANDYRGVDVPGLLGISERGDAWLGLFKSFDGGQTWQSTLLPGYPLDQTKEPNGLASPIHGFQAAADPTIRPGTNGLFYYSGLAFNRGTNAASAVFVARFIDNNNKENGDPTHTNGSLTNLAPTDPIQYLGTVAVQRGTSSQFLDKPWIAADIPRGSATCQIPFTKSDGTQGTQTIPAGRVFLSYSSFSGTSRSAILFTYSSDCGATWSQPLQLSESDSLNQGSIVVVAPTYVQNLANPSDSDDAIVYVAWRRFNTGEKSDALMIAKSSNGGETFAQAVAAANFPSSCGTSPQGIGCAFDQAETATEFRSNAYPGMTADDLGRVYLAWSQRQASGDARIMMQVSADGSNWSAPAGLVDNGAVFDDYGNPFGTISGRGHQLMPTLSFIAGKVTMTYYDQRQDHTLGIFTPKTDLTGYTEVRQLVGELIANPASNLVFNSAVDDAAPPLTSQRHTIDIQGAQASTLSAGNLILPAFTSFRISRYAMGLNPNDAQNSGQVEQLQVSPPNLPMFALGTEPFEGDYIDIAPAPAFVLQNGAWKFNTSPTNLPVFHATWTDNRDVRPPANGDWTQYVPPFSVSNPSGTVHASLFDPTQNVPACVLNVNDGFTATRDQNIYTSIIAPGLVVGALGNSKTLGFSPSNPAQLLQRAFAVTLRNTTSIQRTFRISVGNQPALANGTPDPTGQASLLQNSLQTSLDATISPNTSVARAVFMQSANPTASVTLNVQEISAPGGSVVAGGLAGSVTLNPDPNAPAIQDPDSFGFANPTISAAEIHNPVIGTATIITPPVGNSSILAPAITNPAITNPAITNPAITNPAITNLALLTSLNPAITNPAITNPAITNPAITNPAITNPAITNTSITDASFPLTNTGNTTTSYAVKLFQRAALPAGVQLQLIVVKQYLTPIANGCDLAQSTQNIVVADVPNPVFTPVATLGDPNLPDPAITNATIALAPGETSQIIVRANVGNAVDMQNLVLNNVTPVSVSHSSNTGTASPPATLTILSVTLPDGVVGVSYNTQVNIFGGVGARTASISLGSLPAGLSLDPAAAIISGTPSASGSFAFTFQAADSSTPPVVTSQNLVIRIAAPLLITTPSLSDAVVGTPYSLTLNSSGGLGNTTWSVVSGTLPSGISLNSAGVLSGTPNTVSTAGTPVTIQAQDSGSPAQFITIGGSIHVAPVLSIATQPGALPDAIVGQAYNFTYQSSGGLSPVIWTVASGTLPAGLLLNSTGVISGAPTVANPAGSLFTIQLQDSSNPTKQTASLAFSIRVGTPLTISTANGALPGGIQGLVYNFSLQGNGGIGTLTWTLTSGQLPPGLMLNATGSISGTPTATGIYSFTAGLQDSSNPTRQAASVALSMAIAAPMAITTPVGALPDALYKVAYRQPLASSGGIAPTAWSIASGHLPPGTNLSTAGVIGGSPMALGTYSFTVKVVDSGTPQQSATTTYTIAVAASIKVSFAVQPSNTTVGAAISPAVRVLVLDNLGGVVRGAAVQMTFAANPSGAKLGGQTVQTTGADGVAVFANLSINKAGRAYMLRATVTSPHGGGDPDEESTEFKVTSSSSH
jgi:putative Ig domain-containing protein